MQALKALVIFMGILILFGVGLLGWGVYRTLGGDGSPPDEAAPPPEPAVAAPGLGFNALSLPLRGCRVVNSGLDAGRLVLHLGPESDPACRRILVVDLASGEQGTLHLAPASAPIPENGQ